MAGVVSGFGQQLSYLTYAATHTRTRAHTHTHTYTHAHARTHIHMHTHTRTRTHTHARLHTVAARMPEGPLGLDSHKYVELGLPPDCADFVYVCMEGQEGSATMSEYFHMLEVGGAEMSARVRKHVR